MSTLFASAFGICLATFAFSLAAGFFPILNTEAFLVAIAATLPQAGTIPLVVTAALGQMAGKSLVYLAGAGVLRLPLGRGQRKLHEAATRLSHARGGAMTLTIVSATTGVPPFFAVAMAAGTLGMRFGPFFAAGCGGTLVRFAAVLNLARLVTW